ncbi:MAG: hypothetical protein Q7R41_09700 [Phycisphaerales bacterium]|nr:hypothetical protein [Phycisphaerales bacterium]
MYPTPPIQSFAQSVSLEGDYLAIGSPMEYSEVGEYEVGAAYIFQRIGNAWIQRARVTPSDGTFYDHFGSSVALEGDVLVAGAPQDAVGTVGCGVGLGAAYVFRRTAISGDSEKWVEEAKFTVPVPRPGDNFGSSVAISEGVIVVGKPGCELTPGAVHVYRRDGDTWVPDGALVGASIHWGEAFGAAVDIHGDLIVAGAPYDYSYGQTGSAFVFRRGPAGWTQEHKLLGSMRANGDRFGFAVAVYNDLVAVGAYLNSSAAIGAGRAYIFKHGKNGWIEDGTFVSPNPMQGDWFGFGVALLDSTLAVSALIERRDDTEPAWGAVYVYQRNCEGWQWLQRIVTGDYFQGGPLGNTLSLDGPVLAMSAAGGAAYVSTLVELTDLRRFADYQNCFGVKSAGDPQCLLSDVVTDGTVDLRDLGCLFGLQTGP